MSRLVVGDPRWLACEGAFVVVYWRQVGPLATYPETDADREIHFVSLSIHHLKGSRSISMVSKQFKYSNAIARNATFSAIQLNGIGYMGLTCWRLLEGVSHEARIDWNPLSPRSRKFLWYTSVGCRLYLWC